MGRHRESDIFLNDITVSRRHAEVRRDGHGLRGRRPRLPQRHLRQPCDASTRARCPPGTSSRSASSASCSWRRTDASVALETGRPYFSIGEVLNVLKDTFPDVTVSKIRFLESEGLIEPERTASGYRKFTEDDIERLRFILQAAARPLPAAEGHPRASGRARHAPAPVPGQSKLAFEAGRGSARPGSARRRSPAARSPGRRFSTTELAHASGLQPEQIDELTSFRFLHPTQIREAARGARKARPSLRYDEHDLEAAKLCRALMELGLEPRHLTRLPQRRRPVGRSRRAGRPAAGASAPPRGPQGGAGARPGGRARRREARAGPAARGRRSARLAQQQTSRASVPVSWVALSRRRRAERQVVRRVIELQLVGVRVELPTNQPIVLLKEREGERYLPIWIGPVEATAIALGMQGIETQRPMTHDLMRDLLQRPRGHRRPHRHHRAARRHVLRRDPDVPERRRASRSRAGRPTPSRSPCG